MSEEKSGYTFHIVPREYYEAQPAGEDYRPEPMMAGRERFIHCTDGADNLAATGNRYYASDPRDFVFLVIDKSRVEAPVRYEDPGQIYPHIYGPLNRSAIVEVGSFRRDEAGRFLPPDIGTP